MKAGRLRARPAFAPPGLLGLLLGLVLATGAPAATLPGTRSLDLFDLGAPSFTTFTTRDGLPDPVAVTLQTDRQGFVWVGTQHGLAWYDGKRWHALDDPALDGYVDQLFTDHAGTLWASSRTFGLARYDGTRWHLEGAAEGMDSHRIRRLVETRGPDGPRLWAVTWDAGLFYREQGRWHADPGNAQLPHGVLLSLAQTRSLEGHERLWAGSGSQGLWYRENGGDWKRFSAPGFDPSDIEDLFVTRHGGHEALWISVFSGGLWRLDEHGLRGWSVASGDLPTDELYDMVETPTSNGGHALWVASRSGLVRIYRDRVRVFDRRYGLPSNAIRGISRWRSPNGEDVLWLATEAGVARMIVGARRWKTVSLMGSHEIGVFGVLVDTDARGNQRLWVGSTGDGLGLYEGGRWRYFGKAGGALPDADVSMILHADDLQGHAATWLGTGFGNLWRVHRGPRFEPIATPWPHRPGQSLTDMLSRRVDGHAEQWFATRSSGIYRLRDGAWTAFRPKGVHGEWAVRKLLAHATADGRSWLWATSAQGLARFDGSRWTLLGRDAGLPGIELLGMRLIPDAQGRPILWIGSTHHGIIRVDISDPMRPRVLPPDLPPPPDPTAYDALRDAGGHIYVCTNAGVQLLAPDAGKYRSQTFTSRDGMINDECNTNAQFIDADDRFWTGTLGGLTVYDPGNMKPDRHAKPLRLTRVTIDDKPVTGASVRIPPGQHELRVEFALLSWQHEGESRFRTYLEGFNAQPGAWTADNYRDLGALPAGKFVLHIEARDYAGNSSTPILLPIVVVPHWWQRAWAVLLFVLAAIAMVYGLLRGRTHALRRRQHALQRRIDERTAELNKANLQLLELSQRDALTGVFNRRRLLELLQPGVDDERHGALAALIFIDVDHFKDYNDSFGHLAGDHALRAVADTIGEYAPDDAVVARYGGEEFACLLFDGDASSAFAVAERIRAGVAERLLQAPGSTTRAITISAGVACGRLDADADSQQLLRAADDALYEAKRSGRNCVRQARPGP
ncbi:MAG: diguanylate cyclase [Xanthomonadaceae bacterium]|nr:diguanylate cyclase [Xanthomonadaceae bacterium]MDE3073246.1 diguanylate cyclase [Pseudomonadota bacterium]